jgi:peptidoglycan/xylan/chitin deacetylase (PgdA/CDA1 family)
VLAGQPLDRSIVRRLAFAGLRWSLLPTLAREIFQRRKVTILVYHAPAPQVFDVHLTVLKRVYRLVSLSDYISAREFGRTDDLPPKALIVTLDDGHRTNRALKAVIEKHRVPVTIFACSGILGTQRRFWFLHSPAAQMVQRLKTVGDGQRLDILRDSGFEETRDFGERQALSDRDVDELKPVVDFQSHTRFHPILPQCPTERAQVEIADSRDDLEARLGSPVYALAYPNGSYCDRDVELARSAGYRCALTLDRGSNSRTTPLLRLRRTCVPDDADSHELLVKASGVWGLLRSGCEALRGPRRPRRATLQVAQ